MSPFPGSSALVSNHALQCLFASPYIDPEELQEIGSFVGLSSEAMTTPGAMIPFSAEVGVIETLGRRSSDPLFPVKLGQTSQARSGSVISCMVFASPTMGVALENLSNFTRLEYPRGQSFLVQKKNGYEFWLRDAVPELILAHYYQKFLIGRLLSAFHAATGVPFQLEAVGLPLDQEKCRRLSRALGCPVRHVENHMVFSMSEETFHLPILTHESNILSHLRGYGRVLLEQQNTNPQSMREKVLQEMLSQQHDELPKLADVAKVLALSERTLSRRLADEGLNFRNVVDDARKSRARTLMEDPALSLTEISYRLGFSDQSSFTRAFRRWSGSSPAEARASAR